MPDPIGVGVVGIGFGQHVHVPAFRADPRCEVVAISATSQDRADSVARRLSIEKAFGDWRQLVASPAVHIVAIAVPPRQQPEVAEAAAALGKHIFCEKPIACNAVEALQMLDRVDRAGICHAVDFLFPEIDAFQAAREHLRSGALGAIRYVSVTWHVETRAHKTDDATSWKLHVSEGGGALNGFVSHVLYYVEWLLGPVRSLRGRVTGAAESRVGVWLDFESGASGAVSVAVDAVDGTGHRIEIYGSEGAIVLANPTPDHADGFTVEMNNASVKPADDRSNSDGRVLAASRIARRLIDAVQSGGRVTPSLHEGHRIAVLLDAIRASASTGAVLVS